LRHDHCSISAGKHYQDNFILDYQLILNEIHQEVLPVISKGKIADYITKRSSVSLEKFGMAVHTLDGEAYKAGDDQSGARGSSRMRNFPEGQAQRMKPAPDGYHGQFNPVP
jgi:hypothetical protein